MASSQEIYMFYKPSCPYCIKVLNYLEDLNKKMELKNTKACPDNLELLKSLTNKTQVPCLVYNGVPLLESDAIILWIEEHQDLLENAHRANF